MTITGYNPSAKKQYNGTSCKNLTQSIFPFFLILQKTFDLISVGDDEDNEMIF